MRKVIGLIAMFFLMSAFSTTHKASAGVVTGETPLGGFSKAIDEYIERNGELVNEHDLDILSATMELENGCNSDLCLLLTGSVVLNRTKREWYPDTIEEVVTQNYGKNGQQYASHTVENLYTVRVSERVRKLALHLLLCGPIDTEIVFQSMYPNLGKVKYVVDGEYFATE